MEADDPCSNLDSWTAPSSLIQERYEIATEEHRRLQLLKLEQDAKDEEVDLLQEKLAIFKQYTQEPITLKRKRADGDVHVGAESLLSDVLVGVYENLMKKKTQLKQQIANISSSIDEIEDCITIRGMIIAIKHQGGIVLASESRLCTTYEEDGETKVKVFANNYPFKIERLCDNMSVSKFGKLKVADVVVEIVRHAICDYTNEKNKAPMVKLVAHILFVALIEMEDTTAGFILAGWDEKGKDQIYEVDKMRIKDSGSFTFGGSLFSYLERVTRPQRSFKNLSFEKAKDMAGGRDTRSGEANGSSNGNGTGVVIDASLMTRLLQTMQAQIQARAPSQVHEEDLFTWRNKSFKHLGGVSFKGNGNALDAVHWLQKCNSVFRKMGPLTQVERQELATQQLEGVALD